MSVVLEDSEASGDPHSYVEIVDDTSHIILLPNPADPAVTDSYFLLPTAVNVQAVPVALITTPEGMKYQKHNRVELPPLYTCETCDYNTSRLTDFEKHQLTHWVVKKNTKKQPKFKNEGQIKKESSVFKCPHCNYFTQNYRSLKIHMYVHTKGNAYKCCDCDFKGKNLADLIAHHKRLKKMFCKYCTYSTHSKELFKSHKETNHTSKWFGCMKCKFAASDRSYLAIHMRDRHRETLEFDSMQLEPEPNKPV